jgi:membrane AbrB-like protein
VAAKQHGPHELFALADVAPGFQIRAVTLTRFPIAVQAAALFVLSVVLELLLEQLQLPAALLLGPMAAAIICAALQTDIRIPMLLFTCGQAIVGCMIARTITGSIVRAMMADWMVFIGAVVVVVIISNGLGWLLARLRVLPAATAVWGSSPGGASAMVLMSEAFGADIRLVAFMQYMRVVLVALVATLVARVFTGNTGTAPALIWFPPILPGPFLATLAIAAFGVAVNRKWRLPAGALLVPLFLGATLNGTGVMTIDLPPWLLAASYALVGWSIGLRFTRQILLHAAKAFPRVAVSILVLIALCGGLAVLMVKIMHVNPVTAYLALSPGGVDSVAIIAASSPAVNVPFVMAMQTARFLIVLFAGPPIAKFIAKSLSRHAVQA